MHQNLQKFFNDIKYYSNSYNIIEGRLLCIKKDNKLIIYQGTVFFSWLSKVNRKEIEIIADTRNIQIIQFLLNYSELTDFLNNLSNGYIIIKNKEYFLYLTKEKIQESISCWERKYEREYGYRYYKMDLSYIEVEITGERIQQALTNDVIEEIDNDLIVNPKPFEDFRDLATNFLFQRREPSFRQEVHPRIIIIAPIFIFIEKNETLMDQNTLKINISYHNKLQKSKIKCGLINIKNDGSIERKTIDFKKSSINKQNELNSVKKKIFKMDKIISTTILLHYNKQFVDKLNIYNPNFYTENPNILIHESFDSNLEKYEKFLKADGKDPSRDFEVGILFLLNFLGYSTIYYGKNKDPFNIVDEVDVIAIDEKNKKIIAGECTIKEINRNDKLNKLVRRIHGLKRNLNDYEFLPVIFTAIKREEIPPEELFIASENNIAIASNENIRTFSEWAKQRVMREYFFEELKKLIPPKKIQNRFFP